MGPRITNTQNKSSSSVRFDHPSPLLTYTYTHLQQASKDRGRKGATSHRACPSKPTSRSVIARAQATRSGEARRRKVFHRATERVSQGTLDDRRAREVSPHPETRQDGRADGSHQARIFGNYLPKLPTAGRSAHLITAEARPSHTGTFHQTRAVG